MNVPVSEPRRLITDPEWQTYLRASNDDRRAMVKEWLERAYAAGWTDADAAWREFMAVGTVPQGRPA